MRTSRLLTVCTLAALAWCALSAGQEATRELQMGTKTSDSGFAAALEVEVPITDPQGAEKTLLESFDLLQEAVVQAGFTPLGTAQVVLQISFDTRPQGAVPCQLLLPIIEQPSEDDLNNEGDFAVVPVEAGKVAYTYHKGSFRELEVTFMRLFQYAVANDLEPAGYPRVIVYTPGDEAGVAEVQLPVK